MLLFITQLTAFHGNLASSIKALQLQHRPRMKPLFKAFQYILFKPAISIQKYYYSMSRSPQRQFELNPVDEHQLASNCRKKSDSTLEVAELPRLKSSEHLQDASNDQQQQFSEETYQDMSSGVYEMSRQSEREHKQHQQREYYSQQIKIGGEPPQNRESQKPRQENSVSFQQSEENSQKAKMPLEQFMQNVLSPKLQSEKAPQINQEVQFTYPSLMQSSSAEEEWKMDQASESFHIEQSSSQNRIAQKMANNQQKSEEARSSLEKGCKSSQKALQSVDLLDIQKQQKPQIVSKNLLVNPSQQYINKEQLKHQQSKKVGMVSGKARIISYQNQFFLKIETQVYQIQFCSGEECCTFNRKFSDFVLLDKLIKLRYPGYILYPFPSNHFELFNKIKLSVGTLLQKAIINQKRLLQLENYLNFICSHPQLAKSQVFSIFISKTDELFTREIANMQTQLQKIQQKFGSSKIRQNYQGLKNLVKSGISYFSTFVGSSQKIQPNLTLLSEIRRKASTLQSNFDEIETELQNNKLFTQNIQIKAEKLLQIYQNNIDMKPIDSSIDSVLRLCGKMASSKTAYQIYKSWVEDKMLSRIHFFIRLFSQVQEQIDYRRSLLLKIDILEENDENLGSSIIERVQDFDRRFIDDWQQLKSKFETQYFEMIEQFSRQWQFHCQQMLKIWK